MIKKTSLLVLVALNLLFAGCDNDPKKEPAHESVGVEIYLLDDYQRAHPYSYIKPGTEKLANKPLIEYSDIVTYDSTQHLFEFTEAGFKKIEQVPHTTNGPAFAVVTNGEIIYTGFFIPIYSSVLCDCLFIDPLTSTQVNSFAINMEYPGTEIEDLRNDDKLLTVLRADDKLIE